MAPSRQVLLRSLVAIATKHFNEHLAAVTTHMVAALLDVSDPHNDARGVYQRVKSGNLLKNNSYAFYHLASASLESAMRNEIEQLAPSPLKARNASVMVLSLVPMQEMDDKVAFDAISRPFEMQYAGPIATLNVRLGFLLERDILRIGQNPFRPEMFLAALNQAWRDFEPEVEGHALMLPLLRPSLLFDFAPMYDAMCEALINKGQPGSVEAFNIRKTESAAAAKDKEVQDKAALARQLRAFLADGQGAGAPKSIDDLIPMIPDLPAMPSTGSGWRPSGAAGFKGNEGVSLQPGAPASANPAVARTSVHERGAAGHAGGGHASGGHAGSGQGGAGYGGQGQGGIPDGHAGVPAPLLDMLRNLHAQAPEQFAAGAPSAAEVQAGNVFYLPRLKQSMPQGSLSRGDESTIDLLSKIFETVFLDPNIPKEIRDLIQFLQIPVLKAALVDKDFFFEEAHPARRMIDLLSKMGMEQRKAPDDPLYQAMQRSVERVGRDPDEQGQAFTEAVAELENSIKADEQESAGAIAAPIAAALKQEKVTAATRSAQTAVAARVGSGEVVAMLETFLEHKWTSVLTVAYSVEDDKPGAVGNATRTMDDLIWSVKPKITREARKQLIAKLPTLLATLNKWLDIIKWQDADRLQFFAELAECHASIVRAPIDISPERQLEIAVEVAQADALRRLEKEQAALAAAAAAAQAALDDAAIRVDTLERGMWLEFTQPDASVRKVKLAWISPLRTLYIFSTGTRQEAFSLPVEKLQESFRDGHVKLLRLDGVVGRALSEAMDLAVNDPIHLSASVAA